MHLDDWPHIGAFSYRMKGFLNHTTTHYFKHYQLRLWDRVAKYYYSKNSRNDDFCIGMVATFFFLLKYCVLKIISVEFFSFCCIICAVANIT